MDPQGDFLAGQAEAFSKIKDDALRLLSVRPRSVAELRDRLVKKRHERALIERALENFQKQGLLDDEKFAKLLAGSKVLGRPVGKQRLEEELKKKGIEPQLAQRTISEIGDYDERQAARALVARRFERMQDVSDQKKKARLFGFLRRRGFGQDVIYDVLEELFKARPRPQD
jgi:regulatory protein